MAFTEADKTIYRPSLTMTVLKEVRQLQCESKYCRETSSGIYVIKKKKEDLENMCQSGKMTKC